MSYNEVRDCTSEAVGSESEGSVFDVTIQSYERLTKRAENLIIQAIKYNFPTWFRAYLSKPGWATVGDESSPSECPIQKILRHIRYPNC